MNAGNVRYIFRSNKKGIVTGFSYVSKTEMLILYMLQDINKTLAILLIKTS